MILSYTLILPMRLLETQQLTTALIRSHIEYLLQTYNIVMLILYSKLMRNVAGFKYDLMMILDSGLLFGPPCMSCCTLCWKISWNFSASNISWSKWVCSVSK